MSKRLVFEVYYDASPQRVWCALTDKEELAEWLMESDFEPRVGHRFQFRTKPQPGFDGKVDGEVLEVDEPHRLVYTWIGGSKRNKSHTTVYWTLTPMGKGTKLRLEQTGFTGFSGWIAHMMLGNGWKGLLLRTLKQRVEKPA
jgi:uncharacterized protein YndB with AHSA1/START domain